MEIIMVRIIFLIVFLSLLTSCKKDSSNPTAAGDSALVGTWVLTNITGTTQQGIETVSPANAGISMTLVFNNSNVMSLSMNQGGTITNENLNWSTSNGNLSLTAVGGASATVLPYTISGNKADVNFISLISTLNGVSVSSLIFEFTKQ
jgi:Lipocalin-like domain